MSHFLTILLNVAMILTVVSLNVVVLSVVVPVEHFNAEHKVRGSNTAAARGKMAERPFYNKDFIIFFSKDWF